MSSPRRSWADRELRGWQELADLVRETRGMVLDAYLHRLTRIGSPLARSEDTLSQCMDHSAEILSDLEASLRAGCPCPVGDPDRLARKIGASRAAEGIPPGESLRAAAELFDVAVTTLCGTAGVSADAMVTIAIALNRLIGRRLQEAASAYGQFMLERISEAYAEERRRIARDLHDRVAQNVVAAERNLEYYLNSDLPRDDQRIVRARAALSQTVASIRQVTADLCLVRPVDGLGSALRSYLDTLDPEGVKWQVQVSGDDGSLPFGVRDQMHLVLCEAIRNAVAHAQPTRLNITIDINSYDLRATVTDDGSGLDPACVVPCAGNGLMSMRERTELLGGTLSMSSAPGRGTRIEIFIPLEPNPYGEPDGNHKHHHS